MTSTPLPIDNGFERDRDGVACRKWWRAVIAASALLASLPVSAAIAGEVQSWRQDSASHFQKGELSRLVITSEGRVQLSRQLKSFANLNTAHVWRLVADDKGNVYASTGSPGAVLRIDGTGTVTSLHEDANAQIFALSLAADGTLYAGISPGGTIVRVKPQGGIEALFATGETYVWALAADAAGNVYAATGPNGKLFRVTPTGEGKLLFQSKQPHLLSMALAPSGVAYVGTNGEGLVYRIANDGKAFVVYDAPQADVQILLLSDDGMLYAGTGTPARPKLPSGGSAPTSSATDLAARDATSLRPPGSESSLPAASETAAAAPSTPSESPSPTKSPAPASATPASPGENAVYRIRPDGAVEEVFREKTLVLSLATQQDRLLVGTGQEARLYDVNPVSRIQSEIARLEHGQINALARRPDGAVVVGAGTPGKLYLLENRFASSGTLLSDVFDARLQTRWGRAGWTADVPKECALELVVRTGNVGKPDETWSGWSASPSELPLGRFLQYQASLKSADGASTPWLRDVTIYYATINQPPKIDSIDVPDPQKSPIAVGTSKLKFGWKASDPNRDELTYTLEVLKDGWPAWVRLGEKLSSASFDWDPSTMPSGNYRVRVTASDAASNRPQEALTDARTSEMFVLDREPPTVNIVVIRQVDKRLEIQTIASDKRTRLAAATYAIDGGEWINLYPNDGLFDSLEEQITFLSEELRPGTHVLLVRYQDSGGQWGIADSIVTVPSAP